MTSITVDPTTICSALKHAAPGQQFQLAAGIYGPLLLKNLAGTASAPIELIASEGVVFDGGRRYEDFRLEANHEARKLQMRKPPDFPGVYELAHKGHIRLHNCSHVQIKGAEFRGCWPTGIALKNCQNITLAHLKMQEGTFAIFAGGHTTQGLTIEHCTWVQDITRDRMWRVIPWTNIHGEQTVEDEDDRGLDGDFFRSFGIAGDVTIRHCHIEHAFNGIHMYHSDRNGRDPNLNRGVRIYGNTFSHIRDNAVEPEWGASDWWVYHNDIHNTHKLFSIECRRMSHVYVFGNTGWFDDTPSRVTESYNGGAVWKCPRNPLPAPGYMYVFNNSFYIRSPYIKKKRLRNFKHFNNAIQFCQSDNHPDGACQNLSTIFGNSLSTFEKDRFTKQWISLGIHHPDFPAKIIADGFPVESGFGGNPGFTNPRIGDFRLTTTSAARRRGVESTTIELPDGKTWRLPDRLDLGAFQDGVRLPPPPGIG
jgi:hypothetical protein